MLQVTLPYSLMSSLEILKFVMAADCYPNILVVYRILLAVPVIVASAKFFFSKLKLLNNYLRLNGFAMWNIEKAILDTIDLNTILMILHQETPEEVSFCEPMDIMECKYMIIKLILKVQTNYCFSLQCSPIIIKHVKY